MPIYTFEGLVDMAISRLNPGSTILTAAYFRSPNAMSVAGIVQEKLYNNDGVLRIMCDVFIVGEDQGACDQ